ncbi:MAG: hypothetical protein M3N54_07985 [Acidobacteriota bacterium]|nr:hypothetical protein [Acidobacteriota bacterium]
MTRSARATFVLIACAIGAYYLWGVRAAGDGFSWKQDFDGYYDHLGRGFAGGHLYLPDEPDPALLAQPNPWDPRIDNSLKMFDAVLYHRRYYLYHGAGPAVMLFAPWRLLTHHDLPENFALFLFCFAGFLFSTGALVGLLRWADVKVSSVRLGPMLLALGTCQSVPFLLNRVWVYEVAIGGGYFCVAAGLFFYIWRRNGYWMAAAGLMLGMAIACRPHLGIVGVFCLIAMARLGRRRVLSFVIPFVLVGALVGVYNYERFGNPLNFGNHYLLGGANETEVNLAAANVPPGLFYLMVSPPVFGPVFPWVRLASPPYSIPRPVIYTVEQTAGALFLAPFIPLALVGFLSRRYWVPVASGCVVLLFITATGWSTQRYEVDFLPLFVLCSVVVAARARGVWWIPMGAAIVFGMVVNLALAVSGPYDEMIRTHPARFVKIAGWFSPVARYRPALDPPIDVQFSGPSKPLPPYYRQYLFRAGRYELYIENLSGQRTLVSSHDASQMRRVLGDSDKDVRYRVVYEPRSEEIRVSGDGVELIDQKIGPLVAAPSQIVASPGVSINNK